MDVEVKEVNVVMEIQENVYGKDIVFTFLPQTTVMQYFVVDYLKHEQDITRDL